MAESDCKSTTTYDRILTYSSDGQWTEWEPCPEQPEPPVKPPVGPVITYNFTLEGGTGVWEGENGDTFIQESAP